MFKAVRAFLYVCAATILAAALFGCHKGQQGQQAGAMGGMTGPIPVATILEPVQMIDYAPAIELVGEVRAAQRVKLTAEVGGRVLRIAHRVGEAHGRSSGALIQIDPSSYEAALSGAKAGLAQARERLKEMESGPRPEEIAAQQAMVNSAQAQYEQALDNLERQRKLYEKDVVAESAVVAAEKQAEALKAALQSQQEVLDRLLAGNRSEDIEASRSAVDAAQSAVEAAQLALDRTSVDVPFDAVVSALMVEEGAFVGPGTPLAEVVSDAPCEAWFNLPETDVHKIQPGDTVNVRFDALPDVVIQGSVISVSPAADEQSRQFPVRVSLDDERPKAGMAAYGRLLTEAPQSVIAVKRDAVVLTNLGDTVYVMQPPAPDAKPPMEGMPPLPTVNAVLVTTGGSVGDMVVVKKGDLQPGMMIVTRGNESLYQGASIIPTNLMNQQGGGGAPGGQGAAGGPPQGMGGAPPEGAGGGPPEGAQGGPPQAAPQGEAPTGGGEGQQNSGAGAGDGK